FCDHVLAVLAARGAVPGPYVTTLDAALQERVEAAVAAHLSALAAQHVTQAGLVVLDNESGAVRALGGSASWRAGQLGIPPARPPPGPALTPFLSALATERGDAPSPIAFDTQRPEPGFGHARNADRREHGPARYRDALGSSFNLAALDVVTRRVGTAALTERL